MFKCEKILVPVDFSARDEAAAPFVLSMAKRYGAKVLLFHVLQPPPPLYAGMGGVYPETFDFEGFRQDRLISVRAFAATQLTGVDVECDAQLGYPSGLICETAYKANVDLIAMPTHGAGAFRRLLLGSVTLRVLHDSLLPVWTSAHAPESSHRAHPLPRHILCALDLGSECQKTFETAVALAQDAGADLELVHLSDDGIFPRAEELLRAAEAARVKTRISSLKETRGGVAQQIRSVAIEKSTDLVIKGRGAMRTGFGRINSHTFEIIREAPCPVLSV